MALWISAVGGAVVNPQQTATEPTLAQRIQAQQQMLTRTRQAIEQSCARGVPGAWQVWHAVYGQPDRQVP